MMVDGKSSPTQSDPSTDSVLSVAEFTRRKWRWNLDINFCPGVDLHRRPLSAQQPSTSHTWQWTENALHGTVTTNESVRLWKV